MNSFLNNNLTLFQNRFPDLYAYIIQEVPGSDMHIQDELSQSIVLAKNGSPTLFENGIYIHSRYNPQHEAHKLIETHKQDSLETSAVFFGMGLVYIPIAYAQQYPDNTVLIIEPDIHRFFLAMETIDLCSLFEHPALVLLIATPEDMVFQMLSHIGFSSIWICAPVALSAHSPQYFTHISTLIERNKQKDEINERTLEKFGHLWLHNMCRNIRFMKELDGVASYAQRGTHLSAFILAAGPSLDAVLPFLSEIKKRFLLICVDTALRACLTTGVQPDFIVVVDPQYWNFCHLNGLSAPESIVISESATYPAVFQFECKKKILCSSVFPLSHFFEKRVGTKGQLGAGGSVATTAWDFARLVNCGKIIIAGLDLSFPNKKTHFKGSTFEERAHITSSRLHPAETDSYTALYSAYPFFVCDYEGGKVLTDKRLSLYAWWFESKCAQFPQNKTYTLSVHGMHIPGITPISIEEVLQYPPNREAINTFLQTSPYNESSVAAEFDAATTELIDMLAAFTHKAQKAIALCNTGTALLKQQQQPTAAVLQRISEITAELARIDISILSSEAKDVASLIFPTQRQLEKTLTQAQLSDTSPLGILTLSRHTYEAIVEASEKHRTLLEKPL